MLENRIMEYIMSNCNDMNEKLMVARRYSVNLNSCNTEDKKICKDIVENSKIFRDKVDLMIYYNAKVYQITMYWKQLKEQDKMNALNDVEMCRVIFRDVIKDDSVYEEIERKKYGEEKLTT